MLDFPNETRGLEAYDKTWDFFFPNPRGGALDFRLTTGLRRQGDEWVIVHEHHSVRTIEERFTGAATRQE